MPRLIIIHCSKRQYTVRHLYAYTNCSLSQLTTEEFLTVRHNSFCQDCQDCIWCANLKMSEVCFKGRDTPSRLQRTSGNKSRPCCCDASAASGPISCAWTHLTDCKLTHAFCACVRGINCPYQQLLYINRIFFIQKEKPKQGYTRYTQMYNVNNAALVYHFNIQSEFSVSPTALTLIQQSAVCNLLTRYLLLVEVTFDVIKVSRPSCSLYNLWCYCSRMHPTATTPRANMHANMSAHI